MENLGIDYKLITAQIVNFALFYIVFQKFISKPFLRMLQSQKKDEELREKLSEELQSRQHSLEEENKKLARERKKILDSAVEAGKIQAETVKNEVIQAAKKESQELITKAKSQLEEERMTLMKDMRQQVAEVSSAVLQKAFEEYLTPEAKKTITQHIINHIPKDTKLETS